jgi:hypothetical protein
MVRTNFTPSSRFGNELPNRPIDAIVIVAAGAATVAVVIAYWLPIFQVGGYVYTIIDTFGGRGQFVTAVALPIGLGVAALVGGRRWPSYAHVAALTAAVMVTLASVDHVAEAAMRRENRQQFGDPIDFRSGFVVATVGILLGAVVYVALVRDLLAEPSAHRVQEEVAIRAARVAAIGLLLAIAGQVADSSKAHLWQLSRWPQAGGWWELLVTTVVCGLAIWRRTPMALVSALVVSIVAAASEAHLLRARAGVDDDPAVSSIVRLAGFGIIAVGVAMPLIGAMRSGSLARRA